MAVRWADLKAVHLALMTAVCSAALSDETKAETMVAHLDGMRADSSAARKAALTDELMADPRVDRSAAPMGG